MSETDNSKDHNRTIVPWTTEVVVGQNIIGIISSSIYRSIHIALKELVSNSWDADAENVKIIINEESNQILVIDDGDGMARKSLERYPSIAMSDKTNKFSTKMGRPIIGRYGIGIWSAVPFCKKISVQSTVEGSDEINELEIVNRWVDEHGNQTIAEYKELDTEFEGKTYYDIKRKDVHGTTVILEGIFDSVWNNYIQTEPDQRKSDTRQFPGLDRVKWYLEQYAPIEYHPEAHDYLSIFKETTSYPRMRLFLNGIQLYRNSIQNPLVLDSSEKIVIPGTNIVCRYLILTPKEPVIPEEMRGLQIRLKNVAIGLPKDFDVYKKEGKLYGRMKYITGEIEIIKGLEPQLNLEREDFLPSPEKDEFFKYFRKKLVDVGTLVEVYAEAEKYLGALSINLGVSKEKANYNFLGESSVRKTTKEKIAKKSKTKKQLKNDVEKTLSKIDYKVFTVQESDSPIVVDHKNKVVYIEDNTDKKSPPLLDIDGKLIYEGDSDEITSDSIAKVVDNDTIVFNNEHELFKDVTDLHLIKKLIGLFYYLAYDGAISKEVIDKLNDLLNENNGRND